jgi:adenine phosphoribosyltransferase
MDLTTYLRDIPNFPKPGILFKDITPLLADPKAFAYAADALAAPFRDVGVTAVAGIESRGFIFGVAVAERLGVGFIPLRKEGKLPSSTLAHTYVLEYGEAVLEIHDDAATEGDQILVVDDLLATGGTAGAAIALIEQLGCTVVGAAFVVELEFLGGRAALGDVPISALMQFSD